MSTNLDMTVYNIREYCWQCATTRANRNLTLQMIPHILPWGRAMAVWLWVLLPRMTTKHYSDLTWSSWHLKSPVIRQFIQYLVQANIKENIKLRITAPSPHPSQSAASSEIVSMPWHHHGHRYDVYEWYIIHRNKADTIEDEIWDSDTFILFRIYPLLCPCLQWWNFDILPILIFKSHELRYSFNICGCDITARRAFYVKNNNNNNVRIRLPWKLPLALHVIQCTFLW